MTENKVDIKIENILVPQDGSFPPGMSIKNDKYIFVRTYGGDYREVAAITSADYCSHEDLAAYFIKEKGLQEEYKKYHERTGNREKDFLIFVYDAFATGRRDRQIIIGENFSDRVLENLMKPFFNLGYRTILITENNKYKQ